MSFVSDLKEKAKHNTRLNFVQTVRDNPEYTKILNKLQELTDKREEIYVSLRKTEYEIDVCLTMIEMIREKQELAYEEQRIQQKNSERRKEEK